MSTSDDNAEYAAGRLAAEVYAWIGTVATAWSTLERAIDNALWDMCRINHDMGACLTAQIQSVRQKLIALEALAELFGADAKAIKAVRNFTSQTEQPSRKRNRIVHSPVYYDAATKSMMLERMSADRKLVREQEPIDAATVKAFTNEISDLCDEYKTLMDTHVWPLVSAFHEKLKPQSPATLPPPHPGKGST